MYANCPYCPFRLSPSEPILLLGSSNATLGGEMSSLSYKSGEYGKDKTDNAKKFGEAFQKYASGKDEVSKTDLAEHLGWKTANVSASINNVVANIKKYHPKEFKQFGLSKIARKSSGGGKKKTAKAKSTSAGKRAAKSVVKVSPLERLVKQLARLDEQRDKLKQAIKAAVDAKD